MHAKRSSVAESCNTHECGQGVVVGAAGSMAAPRASVPPVRVITRIIFLHKPTTLQDVLPFILVFFVYGLVAQMLLVVWQKAHRASHKLFQLAMVLVFPPIVLLTTSDRILIVLWMAFMATMAVALRRVFLGPMSNDVPKRVFRTFRALFIYTSVFTFLGHLSVLLSFLFYVRTLLWSLRFLFYSLYIAVLAREVVLNLSHVMAARTGYYSKEGIAGRKENNDVCMICTDELTGRADATGIVTLHCGHSYHDECIRGWCVVGQNRFCPYCKKGVESTMFAPDLWERAELPFRPVMNLARSFMSIFIIVFCVVMYRIR